MSEQNYTGENTPVLSFSELSLPEQQFLELYRNDAHIKHLTDKFCQAQKNLVDALKKLMADGVAK